LKFIGKGDMLDVYALDRDADVIDARTAIRCVIAMGGTVDIGGLRKIAEGVRALIVAVLAQGG